MKFKDLKDLFYSYYQNEEKIASMQNNPRMRANMDKLKGDNVSIKHLLEEFKNLFLCKLTELENELNKNLNNATAEVEIESKKVDKHYNSYSLKDRYDISYYLTLKDEEGTNKLLLGTIQNTTISDARKTSLVNMYGFMNSVMGGKNAKILEKYPNILDAFWHAIYIKLYTQQHEHSDEKLASLIHEKRLLIELIDALQDENKRKQKLVELKTVLEQTSDKIEEVEQLTGDNLTIKIV